MGDESDNEPLFWVPVEHRNNLYLPLPRKVIEVSKKKVVSLDLSKPMLGSKWTECIDREVERTKEREVGELLE